MTFHIQVLKREFEKRQKKNARYSLRAYSSFLGLHPSAVSRVLTSKQLLSPQAGVALIQKLSLTGEESRRFLQSIVEDRSNRDCKRLGKALDAPDLRPQPQRIASDLYKRVATLKYLSILELTLVDGFQSDPSWIASRLGLQTEEAVECISLLQTVGLLKNEDGRLKTTNEHMTAVDPKDTAESNRAFQAELLKVAIEALEYPFEKRAHYGMTMAIDISKIEAARARILAFMEALSDELETGTRTHVYQLGVQLFPISQDENLN